MSGVGSPRRSGHIKLRIDLNSCTMACVLSDAAFRMYISAALYCTEWRMGGLYPKNIVTALRGAPRSKKALSKALAELTGGGFWVSEDDCWRIDGAIKEGEKPLWSPIIPPASWDRSNADAVFARDGYECRYCGSARKLSIDHVIPRCQGGTDHIANLVACCKRCNSRKGGRTPEQAGMVLRGAQFVTETGQSRGPIESSASNERSA